MIIETDRLYLREMVQGDFAALCRMLKNADVMYAYEHAFSDDEAQEWLNRQLVRYEQYGFGLWAVILKNSGGMIGQCGLTMQDCGGREVLEIGYLLEKAHWHMGYAAEAAVACKEYAAQKLAAQEVYSIIRNTNIASQRVAEKNGMIKTGEFVKHYYGVDMPHYIYKADLTPLFGNDI